ncbi:hypothetical protein AOLI_G00057780 [Acnodon oligacanthus]
MKEENYQKGSKRTSLLEKRQVLPQAVLKLEPCDITVHGLRSDALFPDIWKKQPQTLKKPERKPRPRVPTKSTHRGTGNRSEPPAEPNLLSIVGTSVKMSQRRASFRLQSNTTQQIYVTAGRRTLLEPLTAPQAQGDTELKQDVPEVQSKEQEIYEHIEDSSQEDDSAQEPDVAPSVTEQEVAVVQLRQRRKSKRTIAKLCGTLGINLGSFQKGMPLLRVSISPGHHVQKLHEHVEDSSQDDSDSAREPDGRQKPLRVIVAED